jgi:RNA recognition motif-containing protein
MKIRYDGPATAVMMKNVPNNITREELLEVVNAAGFQKDYDIVSLPIDLLTYVGLGYAFINFTTHEQAEKFKQHFHGFEGWQAACDKACETSWSDNLKVYDSIVERYRNSPVMHESVADKYKPALYKSGVRIPFPEPTKNIKAPRPRRRERGGAGKVSSEAGERCETEDPEGMKDTEV